MTTSDSAAPRFSHHGNAFGFLRLFMASAVIVSHAPILLSGDDNREFFHALFGKVTIGEVAVDAFFAISGFLIAGSYLNSATLGSYLVKRFTRIYPAFIVASLICIFVVAPLSGTDLGIIPASEWLATVKRLILLAVPVLDTFHGTAYPMVNGSMWTILYEFRCYLLLIPLGLLGLLRRPWALLGLALAMLLAQAFLPAMLLPFNAVPFHSVWLGEPLSAARLYGIFLCGAAVHAFGDRLRFTVPRVIGAVALLVIGFLIPGMASLAFGLFGTYAVLGIAFLGRDTWMERVNNRNDISYGVYLYAWPIAKLLAWFWHDIPLPVYILLTFIFAIACGWASWHGVEKPALEWARARVRRKQAMVAPA